MSLHSLSTSRVLPHTRLTISLLGCQYPSTPCIKRKGYGPLVHRRPTIADSAERFIRAVSDGVLATGWLARIAGDNNRDFVGC